MGVAELDGIYVSGVPHYSPDGMRKWIILCVSWMSVLSITAVSLRFYSRHLKRQKLWWDDYLIAFSMVCKNHNFLAMPRRVNLLAL